MARTYKTNPVCLVYRVCLVHLVRFVKPNIRDRPNRSNEQDRLVDFFSILLNPQEWRELYTLALMIANGPLT